MTAEEHFQEFIRQYNEILRMLHIAGVSISDMYKLTLNEINEILDAHIDKREESLNDSMYVMHNAASLISMAVWGSKDFPTITPHLRLRPKTEEERNAELQRETQDFLDYTMSLLQAMEASNNES